MTFGISAMELEDCCFRLLFSLYKIQGYRVVVMGDRLNFKIHNWLESVDAFDAILPIIISSLIFTEKSTFYAPKGNSGASGFFFFICPCVKGNNWISCINLGKTYCQSSRRLSVSETSLPCGLVVHINLVIASFGIR